MNVDWDEFGRPKEDTGYSTEELDYVWNKHGDSQTLMKPHDLYRIYSFIHRYPRKRQVFRDLECSHWYLQNNLYTHLHWLSETMDEVQWSDRLNSYNHCFHFPHYVTGVV